MRRFIVLATVVVVSGCGGTVASTDGGSDAGPALFDAGSGVDAGSDAGEVGRDASALDAGALDAGAVPDAGRDAGPPPPRDRLVYVTVGGERRLAVVTLRSDGSLEATPDLDLELSGRPGALAYARRSRRLFVGLNGSLVTVSLDSAGRPSLDGQTPLPGSPVYIGVARDDSFAVTAYFGADTMRVHDLRGAPPHEETDRQATLDEPHAAFIASNDARVYVPHRSADATQWYDLSATGELTLGGALRSEAGVGPRHIAESPDGRFAYVIYEFGDAVASHRVGASGELTHLETVTSLPRGADAGQNSSADIHITPDGRFVYGSNRGDDSIAGFAVDPDGRLTPIGHTPTEERPREFDLSPDGRFVVVAGQESGYLASYRIEAQGELTPVDRLRLGPDLRWAIID